MSYVVGQVLYVALNKQMSVYPMQVVKERTERTLEGETTTYVVRGGPSTPEVQISDVDGEVFETAALARVALVSRATTSIDHLIGAAVEKARVWFPNNVIVQQTTDESKEFNNVVRKPRQRRAQPAQAAISVEEVMENIAVGGENRIIELPDGTKARVGSVQLPDSLK